MALTSSSTWNDIITRSGRGDEAERLEKVIFVQFHRSYYLYISPVARSLKNNSTLFSQK